MGSFDSPPFTSTKERCMDCPSGMQSATLMKHGCKKYGCPLYEGFNGYERLSQCKADYGNGIMWVPVER
jgi:hypothetical protein